MVLILLLKKELFSYTKLPTPITEKAACGRTTSLCRQLNLFLYVIAYDISLNFQQAYSFLHFLYTPLQISQYFILPKSNNNPSIIP